MPEAEIEERMAEIAASIRREAPPPKREPEFVSEGVRKTIENRIVRAEEESGPSLVPPVREKRVKA